MPYAKLETNADIYPSDAESLLKALSAAIAEVTGKPESVVQVALAAGSRMLFAGTDEPTAYIDFKGISLADKDAATLSEVLATLLKNEIGLPPERLYISFSSFKGSMWGVNGRTF